MANFVLDSYAMLAYFRNETGGEKIEQLLNEAAAEKHILYMTSVNAGEVYYMSHRKDGMAKAEIIWKAMRQFPILIVDPDTTLTYKAAIIKANNKLSFADAYAAALAILKKSTLLTGDKEFENLKDLKLKWL